MSTTTGEVYLAGHLPGVRIAEKAVGFLEGATELQHLPWDQFVALTGGAFDREKEYIKGDPVVLVSGGLTDLVPRKNASGHATLDMKAPSDDFEMLGYLPNPEVVMWALDLTYRAWVCLSLAKPLSGFIKPRHSVMFLIPQDNLAFAWQDQIASGIQVQGDADLEYLFADQFCEVELTREDIELADSLRPLMAVIEQTPQLAGALQGLLAAQDAALGRMEQALLCSIALEDLLLEGSKSGLRQGFADRLSALVPATMRDQVPKSSLKGLYDMRSDVLHGRTEDMPDVDDALLPLAPLLLATAIRSIAGAVQSGAEFSEIIEQGADGLASLAVPDQWQPFNEFRRDNRISGYRHSLVTAMSSTMFAPQDTTLVWAPLLGLEAPPKGVPIGQEDRDVLLPLKYEELEQLEDRLIRMDFMQRMSSAIRAGDFPDAGRACLMVPVPGGQMTDLQGRPPIDYPTVRAFVIAMRALGFGTFVDPKLLGEFRYHEKLRLRIPTIYRQTLLVKTIEDYDQPSANDLAHASALRDVVLRIARDAPRIDRLLTLLREAHFQPVVDTAVRARLCFAFLDGVIGRISGDDIGGKVALIGQNVAPGDPGLWFSTQARAMRNRLAHSGDFRMEDAELAPLLTFANALALSMLRFLGERDEITSLSLAAYRTELMADASKEG